MPTLASQVGQIAPVTADRTSAYVDPNAGFQGVNAQNALYGAQAQAAVANNAQSQGQASGWGSTIGGVVGGIAGAYFGGPVGAQAGYGIGSGVGGGIGSSFSDARLKQNIHRLGTMPSGVGLYKFAMRHNPAQKHVGLIAQDVERHVPGAVATDPGTGLKAVNYMRAAGVPGPMRIS